MFVSSTSRLPTFRKSLSFLLLHLFLLASTYPPFLSFSSYFLISSFLYPSSLLFILLSFILIAPCIYLSHLPSSPFLHTFFLPYFSLLMSFSSSFPIPFSPFSSASMNFQPYFVEKCAPAILARFYS